MLDQIAASTLGAVGFFMPDIHKVRHDAPYDAQVDRDLIFGAIGAVAFSFLIASAVANRQGRDAYLYWLIIVGALGSVYYYAYQKEE